MFRTVRFLIFVFNKHFKANVVINASVLSSLNHLHLWLDIANLRLKFSVSTEAAVFIYINEKNLKNLQYMKFAEEDVS